LSPRVTRRLPHGAAREWQNAPNIYVDPILRTVVKCFPVELGVVFTNRWGDAQAGTLSCRLIIL